MQRAVSSRLSLPQVIPIHKDGWAEVGFDENSALKVMYTGEEGYDFYVNMDNICLLSEIKAKSEIDAKLLLERYKYAMVLIGLALLKEYPKDAEQKKDDKDIYKEIMEITAKLSHIVLPMISYLGELEIED